jgi:hypothetical protein
LILTTVDGSLRDEVTDIVQLWVDGTIVNNGLIVMPLEDSRRPLKLHSTPDLNLGAKAKVRVWYTPEERE